MRKRYWATFTIIFLALFAPVFPLHYEVASQTCSEETEPGIVRLTQPCIRRELAVGWCGSTCSSKCDGNILTSIFFVIISAYVQPVLGIFLGPECFHI